MRRAKLTKKKKKKKKLLTIQKQRLSIFFTGVKQFPRTSFIYGFWFSKKLQKIVCGNTHTDVFKLVTVGGVRLVGLGLRRRQRRALLHDDAGRFRSFVMFERERHFGRLLE
jgi:hypothetical protein